ncbi:MAG: acetylglutamate kinase, partial [Dehalococcoidia bacterium]|nr:acetylglutamate kinase [Dehalococcoidia bacterium]
MTSACNNIIVIKLGGSTLGSHDTTLEDLVALQRSGVCPVVVHGGGKLVSEWLKKQGVATEFVRGLRVTDAETLQVVIAVLAGLVNKELVASIHKLGGRAFGLSCADGGIIQAEVKDADLGYVGEVSHVDPQALRVLLTAGYLPVIAPVSILKDSGNGVLLANMNGDTVAGALAAALGAQRLVFLTDVDGIHDASGKVLPRLTEAQAQELMSSGAASGGMLPKLDSCLKALRAVSEVRIIDGRKAHALLMEVEGKAGGTTVV